MAATTGSRSLLASAPSSLASAVVKGSQEGNPVHVLIDSGASENFVDTDIVRKLVLPIAGRATSIGMASSEVSMQTLGRVSGVLILMDRQYRNASFHVMPKLCADVIVGQEFLKRHASITFVMNGPEESLTIKTPMTAEPQRLSVAAAKLEAPRLFEFLSPDAKPVASKSRRYNQEDQAFIEAEVGRLLAADVIEPSRSPWRAQVLVVKQKDKKRLVIDYSSTVNRFTVLDAYPLPNIEDLVNKVAQDNRFATSLSSSTPLT